MKKVWIGKKRYILIGTLLGLAIIFIIYILFSGYVPAVKASNLMTGIKSNNVTIKKPDATFVKSVDNFSLRLFNASKSTDGNTLISPVSVIIALSMVENGADKETLSQMSRALSGDIPLSDWNQYIHSYLSDLPNSKKSELNISNSIWYRDSDDLKIKESFLQTNADYYKASIYQAAFDNRTKNDINHWVKTNTHGLIDRVIDRIGANEIMYLVNTIFFDARWDTVYQKKNVSDMMFHNEDGSISTVRGMTSGESIYISDDKATGFMKPYYGDHYRFVAVLPHEGINLNDYMKDLSGETFYNLLNQSQSEVVETTIPKLKYNYAINLNQPLQSLGIKDAFSTNQADFSKMGESSHGNIYISEAIHKACISIDELGTKAGAVTVVGGKEGSAPMDKSIILNRPFLFAIVDTKTSLPLFMGTVTNLN